MSKHDDSLFLLEVLVDKIVFVKSPCFSDKDFKTCVLFECQGLEPLEICDEDSDSCAAKSGGPFIKKLNRGKSCLFPMKESDIASAMSKFPIKVTVYKSLPCGCIPTKIIMGEATIDMTKEFVEARNRFLANPMSISYQTLKDSFRISGPDGNETGEILLFLRISCFGNLIVTHFQGGIPPSLGVGTGNNIIDRSCNPRKEYQTVQDPCACGATKSSGVGTSSGKNAVCNTMGSGVCPPDPYNSMPCQDSDDPCYCTGPKFSKKSQMACRNIDQYCLHVPKDCCPTGNKVIFQIPTDTCGMNHKQRVYFNMNSHGIGDLARDEPGQLLSPTSDSYPGVKYDFPDQVIKLRVGKTVDMPGRKSKLEYQFITPDMRIKKEVPVKDTRTAQCIVRNVVSKGC